jgi:chromosome partitioning protein
MVQIVTVAGLKGGVGKTTSSVYLAHGLATKTGSRVLLVDADPQGSALSWDEQSGDSFREAGVLAVSLPVRDLHRRVADLGSGYGWVVIDTPPGDLAISASAIRAAGEVLLPLAPATIDVDRLRPTLEMLAEVDPLRAEPVSPRVLLTRVRAGTINARAVREMLISLGLEVMAAQISLREAYASAFGAAVTDLGDYADVVAELLDRATT